MTDIPDSIDPRQLAERIRQLRDQDQLPPRGSNVPSFLISAPDAGQLDLTLTVEQILLEAGGANVLQLMQLAGFLLDAITSALEEEIGPYVKGEVDVSPEVSMAVVARTRADLTLIDAANQLVHGVMNPLVAKLGGIRANELSKEGYQGIENLRRVLVSDSILESLGIDKDDYEPYFSKRFSKGL